MNGVRFVGRQDSLNSLVFPEAIQEKTWAPGVCHVRVANVRLNAFQLGPANAPMTATLVAQRGATGERARLADQIEVGCRRPGLVFRVLGHDGEQHPAQLSIAAGVNTSLAEDAEAQDARFTLELCFREVFPAAFRTDLQEAGTDGATVFGTRLMATFHGIPNGVDLYVTAAELADHAQLSPADRSAGSLGSFDETGSVGVGGRRPWPRNPRGGAIRRSNSG